MLTRTTEVGLQVLLYLALRGETTPVTPRRLAQCLQLSPSYLAKVAGQLVRANLLVARHGSKGGVSLARVPAAIPLLDVVQALQGVLTVPYCQTRTPNVLLCGFHRAMLHVHQAVRDAFASWTLADLVASPSQHTAAGDEHTCLMRPVTLALAAQAAGGPAI